MSVVSEFGVATFSEQRLVVIMACLTLSFRSLLLVVVVLSLVLNGMVPSTIVMYLRLVLVSDW